MALVYNHLNANPWRLKILLLLFLSCIAGTAASTTTFLSPHNDITCLVLKRLYVVARLEKMCSNFFAIRQSSAVAWMSFLPAFVQPVFATQPHPAVGILTEMLPVLHHQHIRFHVEAASTSKNIKPLYTLWKELCAYRFLDDDLFAQEFCQLMYVVFARCMKKPSSARQGSTQSDSYNKSLKQEVQALTPDQARAIAQRFYLIQRLQRAMDLCAEIYSSSDDPTFTIMLALWDETKQYKNIDKITASFAICSSLIALLDNAQNHLRPTRLTIESTALALSRSEIADHAALENLLEYIDSITDSCPCRNESSKNSQENF